ncbi:MAG: hypothetical protein DWQ47_16250 [Acidobacteria bacterium]|nr:MAG: hypothetical protein DWQ32_03650 [Acidobacteriota bacterium]REK02394.1 MAG: hypothetical protein DWQ38_08485 [Acidobacteriota bacterium]REK13804.1 MAG: hypothetical protein DWQ43_09340 [Acidobacteriota bacterium]REK41798.1 MAG: hypothetical protein DWQ47_16250 [Acidobacteriota bacterium]
MKSIVRNVTTVVLLAVAALLSIQCAPSGDAERYTAGPNAERYEMTGVVESVDKKNKTAMIRHDDIPGFMEPMTMKFEFKDEWVWDVLKEGSKVSAVLVVDNQKESGPTFWLENANIVESTRGEDPVPPKEDVAVEGKQVIEFSLTDQDGEQLSPNDFEGKAWALTFIYTECPLPEYCILMSRNFSDLANRITGDEELSDRVRLLSISFDPNKDTPEKLRNYGLGYLGRESRAMDFKIWKLAVGDEQEIRKIADFFGLFYKVSDEDKAQFDHSLRTVVIGPDGKVRKVFAGSDWTQEELLEELRAAIES